MKTFSAWNWNLVQLLQLPQSSMICPQRHFHHNTLGPGPLHSKGKIRVFLLQEVLFALVVHSVGVREYGHDTAEAQERLLDSEATNKVFFLFWEGRGLLTSMLLW